MRKYRPRPSVISYSRSISHTRRTTFQPSRPATRTFGGYVCHLATFASPRIQSPRRIEASLSVRPTGQAIHHSLLALTRCLSTDNKRFLRQRQTSVWYHCIRPSLFGHFSSEARVKPPSSLGIRIVQLNREHHTAATMTIGGLLFCISEQFRQQLLRDYDNCQLSSLSKPGNLFRETYPSCKVKRLNRS